MGLKDLEMKLITVLISILVVATAVAAPKSLDDTVAIQQRSDDSFQSSHLVTWNETQKLLAVDGETGDQFGISLALDGDTALIGAQRDNDNGLHSGSAYVFSRDDTVWSQQAKLNASYDGNEEDHFGFCASLSGDTALIGAPDDDDNGVDSGSAYVFTRSDSVWIQQAKLLALDGADSDEYGWSVSLSGDTAFIGAPGDDDKGNDSGSVYVFKRMGPLWTQQQKLSALDATSNDYFGFSLSLDNDTAIIGAPGDDTYQGSVYVFIRIGTTWTQQAKLQASDGLLLDEFGYSVSLSGDTLLVGAYMDDNQDENDGSAYVFSRTDTTWIQQDKLEASDSSVDDRFGISVSLSGDTALIGAYWDDVDAVQTGSAYVFVRNGTNWSQQEKLVASDRSEKDYFGFTLFLEGDTALIGAYHSNFMKGSAYLFERTDQPVENHKPAIPNKPSGSEKGNAKESYMYSTTTTDPDGDNVFYMWDWGDETPLTWDGPFNSGQIATASHIWSTEGSYSIKVKAKDISGEESNWSDPLPITMPYSCSPIKQFVKLWFEWFPNTFLLLRQVIGS